MQPWEGQLNDARSVDDVMVAVCDFLNHQRAERHDALLPVNCRQRNRHVRRASSAISSLAKLSFNGMRILTAKSR